jgi:hypothetical protein
VASADRLVQILHELIGVAPLNVNNLYFDPAPSKNPYSIDLMTALLPLLGCDLFPTVMLDPPPATPISINGA